MPDQKTVLVVDDNENIRSFLKIIFRSLGLDVFQAEDNMSAVAILSDHSVSLITTDIMHPYDTGIDFIRQVRSMPKVSSIPIVVITGQDSRELELDAWRSGATAFQHKPIGIDQLLMLAKKLMGQASTTDINLLTIGVEGPDLDYKEIINFESNSGRAELARDVIGMANSGGGTLIIGVAEKNSKFVTVGLSSSDLNKYETTRLNDSIRKYVMSTASVSSKVVEYQGNAFVFVKVHEARDTLALASIQNENVGLFPGRIYIRTQTGSTTELKDPLELRRLIDRLVDNRIKLLLGNSDELKGK